MDVKIPDSEHQNRNRLNGAHIDNVPCKELSEEKRSDILCALMENCNVIKYEYDWRQEMDFLLRKVRSLPRHRIEDLHPIRGYIDLLVRMIKKE